MDKLELSIFEVGNGCIHNINEFLCPFLITGRKKQTIYEYQIIKFCDGKTCDITEFMYPFLISGRK